MSVTNDWGCRGRTILACMDHSSAGDARCYTYDWKGAGEIRRAALRGKQTVVALNLTISHCSYPARNRSGKTFERTMETHSCKGPPPTKAAGPSISVAKGKLKPSVKESGACGLEDMPAEVLTTIAQHIDPKT